MADRVLLLTAGVQRGEITYSLEALRELTAQDKNLELINGHLWWVVPEKVKPKAVTMPPDPFPTCQKCGRIHLLDRPRTKYLQEFNLLEKQCLTCGFIWLEDCIPPKKEK